MKPFRTHSCHDETADVRHHDRVLLERLDGDDWKRVMLIARLARHAASVVGHFGDHLALDLHLAEQRGVYEAVAHVCATAVSCMRCQANLVALTKQKRNKTKQSSYILPFMSLVSRSMCTWHIGLLGYHSLHFALFSSLLFQRSNLFTVLCVFLYSQINVVFFILFRIEYAHFKQCIYACKLQQPIESTHTHITAQHST